MKDATSPILTLGQDKIEQTPKLKSTARGEAMTKLSEEVCGELLDDLPLLEDSGPERDRALRHVALAFYCKVRSPARGLTGSRKAHQVI